MGRIRKKSRGGRSAARRSAADANASASTVVAEEPIDFTVKYAEASGLAVQGKNDDARRIHLELDTALARAEGDIRLRADDRVRVDAVGVGCREIDRGVPGADGGGSDRSA